MSNHTCVQCGKDLSGKRADARFCGEKCKKRWQRADENALARESIRKRVKVLTPPEETRIPASKVLGMLKSRIPSAPVIPRGTPIVAPSRKKAQPKGGSDE